jgi:hypothetical protein
MSIAGLMAAGRRAGCINVERLALTLASTGFDFETAVA